MNANEERLINALREHACDHTPTLKPHPFYEDKFSVMGFYVEGHEELMLTIRALTYLCQVVLDPEFAYKESKQVQTHYIQHLLSISKRFMPLGEEALLDHLNLYFREERLKDHLRQ